MKKIIQISILLLCSIGFAQGSYIGEFSEGAGLSDSRLMDAIQDFTSKMNKRMVLTSSIKGSPFFEEKFQKGTLDYFGRKVKGDSYFRYNSFNDEIEIGEYPDQKEAQEIIIQSPKVICYINNEKYVYLPFKGKDLISNQLGYLIVLFEGKNYTLYQRRVKEFKEATVARTSYERSFPPRFVPKVDYYLSVNESTAIPIEAKVSKIVKNLSEEDRKKAGTLKKEFKKIKSDLDLINFFTALENRG
ncbi:MAG: hypothetical protein ACPG8F_06870 [Flavobacteriaceae bacterium]